MAGMSLAALAQYLGLTKLVVIFRDDAWGAAFSQVFVQDFKGTTKTVRITPDLPDYASEVASASAAVDDFGADKQTGVVMLTFEAETVNIVSHMREHPSLAKVKMIGTWNFLQPGLLPPQAPPELGRFLASVGLLLVSGTVSFLSPQAKQLYANVKQQLGTEADYEILFGYDAAYLAMLSVLVAGSYNGEAIGKAILGVAATYHGLSGWKIMDENGDDIYQDWSVISIVEASPGNFSWVPVGTTTGGTVTMNP